MSILCFVLVDRELGPLYKPLCPAPPTRAKWLISGQQPSQRTVIS